MAKAIQAVRGMNDILPQQISYWQKLESVWRDLMRRYGYQEIRFPIVESTALFKRSIGEVTDIVEKEMYTFDDRNGDSLTLRPEGTAVCVRAGIEQSLLYNQIQRLWYMGPMFRHERPQKGRYRQFHQFGVEAFGMQGPDVDAELILMTHRFWQELGLGEHVKLQLNSLGSAAARAAYREKLVGYLNEHIDVLDEDSKRRLESNPLRILDSKNPQMQSLIEQAPRLLDHLDEESLTHFEGLRKYLDAANIPYVINSSLVRGLDYYCMTVFEWVTDRLGAQGTVCAGGRYDGLVAQLGGKATPAVGFAAGMERLVLLLESVEEIATAPDIFCVLIGAGVEQGMLIAERLRTECPALAIECNLGAGSFKSQFKRADKSGARWALIIADDEVEKGCVSLKDLRGQEPQRQMTENELIDFFARG